jgi:hypothetical protein
MIAMEGVSNFESGAESHWKGLKEQAHERMEQLIGDIAGFDELELSEKILALGELMDKLSENNENRYAAREISLRCEIMKETLRHNVRMQELGVTA